MGKGPAIILADASGRGILTQQSIKDLLIKAGDENEIDYQLEVSDGGTTDGTAIHLTREGIPTGVLFTFFKKIPKFIIFFNYFSIFHFLITL